MQADPWLKQNREDLPVLAHLQGLYLFLKEHGLILNQELNSDQAYPVAKRLNTLLRHGDLPREEDGAIEFWRLKIIFGTILSNLNIGLMMCGRARWQEAEATRKYFNTVLEILDL